MGSVIGGTWLSGPRAPTVGGDAGVMLGLGAQRGVSPDASAGVVMRLGTQGLTLTEQGSSWSGGTLTEANIVGVLSLASRRRTRTRVSLDLGGGMALVSGARDIQPFLDAGGLAPLGEIGLSVRRGGAEVDASRRDLAVFARYSALRLGAAVVNAETTSGWVRRLSLGLRVTR